MILKLIVQKLVNFLSILIPYKANSSKSIPELVDNEEKAVRIIYSPKYVTKEEKIKSNAFGSPSGLDEVSVIRLKYSSADYCKSHGLKNQNFKFDRTFFGLAVIDASEIRNVNADIESSPLPENPAHADIKIGYVRQKGVPLPSEFKYKVDEMAKIARLYKDTDVNEKRWKGKALI